MTINFTLGLVVGIELLAVAALLFLFGRSISRRWPSHAWLVSFGRIALAIVGLGLASATLFDTTDTERWELVNYLRSINGGRPSADAAERGVAMADVGPGVVVFGLPLTFGALGAGFVVRAARRHRPRRRR